MSNFTAFNKKHVTTRTIMPVPVPGPEDPLMVRPRKYQHELKVHMNRPMHYLCPDVDKNYSRCKAFWNAVLFHEPMRTVEVLWSPTFSRGFGLTPQSAQFILAFWETVATGHMSQKLRSIRIILASEGFRINDVATPVKVERTTFTDAELWRPTAEGDMRTSGILNVLDIDYEGVGGERRFEQDIAHPLLALELPTVAVVSAPKEFQESDWCNYAIANACGRALRILFPSADIMVGGYIPVPTTAFQAEMKEAVARAQNLIHEVCDGVWTGQTG